MSNETWSWWFRALTLGKVLIYWETFYLFLMGCGEWGAGKKKTNNTGISLFGTPGARQMISDSKTDSLCKIQKKMLFTVDTGRLWTHRMLRFQLCQMETVGEDGAATDGRRKEIHCHSCKKEKHFFFWIESSSCGFVYGYICLYKYRKKHCHITAHRKWKLGVAIFSFRKK